MSDLPLFVIVAVCSDEAAQCCQVMGLHSQIAEDVADFPPAPQIVVVLPQLHCAAEWGRQKGIGKKVTKNQKKVTKK